MLENENPVEEGTVEQEVVEESTSLEEGLEATEDVQETSDESEEGADDDSADEVDAENADLSDEEDELAAILATPKDGAQKRIDKLTARLKDLEEKNAKLETMSDKGDTKQYTETQLKSALKDALADGNHDVVWEIMEYRQKQTEEKLERKYRNEQEGNQQKNAQMQQEWTTLIAENKEFTDPDLPELFSGSRADLNLAAPNSLLKRISMQLYSNPEKISMYHNPGGQRLAVADAFKLILKAKRQKGSSKEVKRLNKKLSREKRKHSLASSKVSKPSKKAPRELSDEERLAEYITSRKKPIYAK